MRLRARSIRSLVLGLAVALAALAALPRAAAAASPFSYAYIVSSAFNAGAANVDWDVTMGLPVGEVFDSSDSVDIEIFLPGGTDAAHPGYDIGGLPFLAGTVDGLTSQPRYLSSYYTGNAAVGVHLHVILAPYDGWTEFDNATLHLHHIVNAGTPGATHVKILISDLAHGGVRVDTTDMSIDVLVGSVATYKVEQYLAGSTSPISQKTAGEAFTLSATSVDRFGNLVDTTASLAFSDSTGTLTPVAGALVQAQTVFPGASIRGALGSDRVRVTDGIHTGYSNYFPVVAGALTQIRFLSLPTQLVANDFFNATLQARDQYGNRATGFNGNVTVTDLTGTVGPNPVGPFIQGQWSGGLVIGLPIVADSITATFTPSILGVSPAFIVAPQTLARFTVGVPSTATAGAKFAVTVRADDAAGYTVKAFNATVSFSDDTGTLSPLTSKSFVQGALTDSVRVTRAGSDHLHVADSANHTGNSAAFTVNPATITHLSLSGYPATVTQQAPFPLTVTALDAYDNVTPAVSGPASLSDTKQSMSPNTTGTFANGAWTGTVALNDTAQADVITASVNFKPSPGPEGLAAPQALYTGQSGPIHVLTAGVVSFSVNVTLVGAPVAGVPFGINVQALDAGGIVYTPFVGTVTLSDSSGTLAPGTSGSFTAGTLSQLVTIYRSGPTHVSVSDGNGHTGRTSNFGVNPGSLDGFEITVPPQLRRARQNFPVRIRAVDASGNTATGFTGTVGLTDRTGTLTPTVSGAFRSGAWNDSVMVGRGRPLDQILLAASGLPPVISDTFGVFSAIPQILAVTPPVLPPGEAADLVVTGHFFETLATLGIGPGVTLSGYSVVSEDTLRVHASAADTAHTGPRNVIVSQYQAVDTSNTVFSVAFVPPEVTGISPSTVAQAGHVRVQVRGKHFETGATVSSGTGVTFGSTLVVSPETLSADIAVDSTLEQGGQYVYVTTTHGTSPGVPLLHVVPRPVVSALQPDSGAAGLVVNLARDYFEFGDGATDSIRVGGVPAAGGASGVTQAAFTVPQGLATGPRGVTIFSYGAWSLPASFRVLGALRGDVDGNGRVDFPDITITVQAIFQRVNLTGRALFGADCDGSGVLNVLDLLCMVDLAVHAVPQHLDDPGIPESGTAVWDAARGELRLPAEAVALAWRSAGTIPPGNSRSDGAIGAWVQSGPDVYGLGVLLGAGPFLLPQGQLRLTDVLWADASGRLHRARIQASGASARFSALANPQQGALGFYIPVHDGPSLLELFSADGRRVATRTLGVAESGPLHWAPGARLGAGIYWARFTSAASQETVKLLMLP